MASSVSLSGIGSGLDSTSIINELVAAEEAPIQTMQQSQSDLNAQLSSLGDLLSKVQTLGTQLADLSTPSSIASITGTSSDPSTVSVSATGGASPGSYAITVNALAQAQTSISAQFASNSAGIAGTGSVTINGGTPITFDGTKSLTDIANAINAQAGAKLTASVLYDGAKYRLVIASNQTGVANGFTVSETGGPLGITTTNPPLDASMTINNVTVTRPSNQFADVVPGVSFTAQSATPTGGAATSVIVQNDPSALQAKVQNFVTNYNAIVSTVTSQLSYSGTQKGNNTLFGDPTLQLLQNTLNRAVASNYSFGSGSTSAELLGISINEDNTLSLDTTKFSAAIASDPQAFQRLMLGDGTPSSGLYNALNNVVTEFSDPSEGLIVSSEASRQAAISNYDKQIALIQDAGTSLGNHLTAQFAQLDALSASIKSEQSYLNSLFPTTPSK